MENGELLANSYLEAKMWKTWMAINPNRVVWQLQYRL
jgi:hypothetical protein